MSPSSFEARKRSHLRMTALCVSPYQKPGENGCLKIQLVLDGRDTGLGAGFVRIAAGRARHADRADQ